MKNLMYFDDAELLQLEFCMKQTKNQMSMGGEILRGLRRHASITQKIEKEMERRIRRHGES